jgi:NurA-like 5'-3' nuclease
MVYKCKITEIQKSESKQYATAYTYFPDNKPIGRVVITKKIAGIIIRK